MAKVVQRLQRELKAFNQLRMAQVAAYNSGRLIWEDIQDSQRMLRAAGRDPVEVLKGLQDDEDFKMTPDQVKTLGEVLGWPVVGDSVPVTADNLRSPSVEGGVEASVPLQSSVRISLLFLIIRFLSFSSRNLRLDFPKKFQSPSLFLSQSLK